MIFLFFTLIFLNSKVKTEDVCDIQICDYKNQDCFTSSKNECLCSDSHINRVSVLSVNADCNGYIFNERGDTICNPHYGKVTENVFSLNECAGICQNTGFCRQFAYNSKDNKCWKCENANSNLYKNMLHTTVYDFDYDYSNYCPHISFLPINISEENTCNFLTRGESCDVKMENGIANVKCTDNAKTEIMNIYCDKNSSLSEYQQCLKSKIDVIPEKVKYEVLNIINFVLSVIYVIIKIILFWLSYTTYKKYKDYSNTYKYKPSVVLPERVEYKEHYFPKYEAEPLPEKIPIIPEKVEYTENYNEGDTDKTLTGKNMMVEEEFTTEKEEENEDVMKEEEEKPEAENEEEKIEAEIPIEPEIPVYKLECAIFMNKKLYVKCEIGDVKAISKVIFKSITDGIISENSQISFDKNNYVIIENTNNKVSKIEFYDSKERLLGKCDNSCYNKFDIAYIFENKTTPQKFSIIYPYDLWDIYHIKNAGNEIRKKGLSIKNVKTQDKYKYIKNENNIFTILDLNSTQKIKNKDVFEFTCSKILYKQIRYRPNYQLSKENSKIIPYYSSKTSLPNNNLRFIFQCKDNNGNSYVIPPDTKNFYIINKSVINPIRTPIIFNGYNNAIVNIPNIHNIPERCDVNLVLPNETIVLGEDIPCFREGEKDFLKSEIILIGKNEDIYKFYILIIQGYGKRRNIYRDVLVTYKLDSSINIIPATYVNNNIVSAQISDPNASLVFFVDEKEVGKVNLGEIEYSNPLMC